MYDYSGRDQRKNEIIDFFGTVFTFIFLMESLCKICAMGFLLHPKSYLREGWNVVDFFIVLSGILEITSRKLNLKSLRLIRVMRPLKSIRNIRSMRNLVGTLISSLPDLLNVSIFMLFIMVLFGVMGLQSFKGTMYGRCRFDDSPNSLGEWAWETSLTQPCTSIKGKFATCPSDYTCGFPIEHDISLSQDNVFNNPQIQFNVAQFQDFWHSILAVFQIITMDNWSRLMQNLMSKNQISASLFCCFLILLGPFFLMNLVLAVIMQAFNRILQIEIQQEVDSERKKGHSIGEENGNQQPAQKHFVGSAEEIRLTIMNYEKQPIKRPSNIQSGSLIKRTVTQIKNMLGKQKSDKGDEENQFLVPSKMKMSIAMRSGRNGKRDKRESKSGRRGSISKKEKRNSIQIGTPFPQDMEQLRVDIASDGKQKLEDHFFIQRQYEVSETIVDLKARIQRQNWIFQESQKLLKNRQLIIKQMLCESYKKNYGINNEEELVSSIRKYIKKDLQNVVEGKKFSKRDEDGYINPIQRRLLFFSLAVNRKILKKIEDPKYFSKINVSQIKNQMYLKYLLQQVIEKQQMKYSSNKLNLRAQRNMLIGLCYKIQSHSYFNLFITACIVSNTVVLAQDRYPIQVGDLATLDSFNTFFYVIFFFEMITKLVGLGQFEYFKDKFNTFDCVVVLISTVDVVIVESIGSQGGGGAISAMRAFRLLRVFKLAKSWQNFKELLMTIGSTMIDVGNFSILLFLLIFTYTLLGLELFSFKAKFNYDLEVDQENGTPPIANFNTFLKATTSVFIVLANDGWTDLFIDHYRSTNKIIASVYFLSLIIIGQYIMLNLFLAILLKNFDESSLNREIKKNDVIITGQKSNMFRNIFDTLLCRKTRKKGIFPDKLPLGARKKASNFILHQKTNDIEDYLQDEKFLRQQKMLKVTGDSAFKQLFYKATTDSVFENFILLLILVSSVQLALENPLNDPESSLNEILFKIDLTLTIIFTIEALMKILAFGFLMNGCNSYLRQPSNVIDFFVVIVSIASLVIDNRINLGVLKVFRLMRIMRPLRMISKNEGLKLSIVSLFESIPQILNVILVSFLFFLIFGIIGVNYLKGQYYYCEQNDEHKFDGVSVTNKWNCNDAGGIWSNYLLNFNNILEAIVTLFTLANRVGWVDLMFRAVASNGIDQEPIEDNRPAFMIFFFVFIIVASFFVLNLFVGIVISTYNREKEKQGKDFLLTNKQKKWLKSRILIVQSLPRVDIVPPTNSLRKLFFKMAISKFLDYFIYLCIVFNIIVLTIDWYGIDEGIVRITDYLNLSFAVIFTIEAFVKLVAFDKSYFADKWNVFDFVIVLGTDASIFMRFYLDQDVGGPQTTVIRAFRIGRIMRLFKRNKSLQIIFETFIITTPHLVNIGSLMMLFLYMYSVLGVQLFSNVKIEDPLNEIVNFQTIGIAFLTLFKVATGEKWHLIRDAISQSNTLDHICKQNVDYYDYKDNNYETLGCGNEPTAIIFFFSFVILINLIFINLFTAIVLHGYSETHQNDSRQFNAETTVLFQEVWAKFDTEGTSFIHIKQFDSFMEELGLPLGWSKQNKISEEVKERWHEYVNLKKYSGQYYQYKNIMEKLAMMHIIKHEIKDFAEIQELDLKVDKVPKRMIKRLKEGGQIGLFQQIQKQKTKIANKRMEEFNRREKSNQYAQRIDSPKLPLESKVISLENALKKKSNNPENKFKLALMKKLGLQPQSQTSNKQFYKQLQKIVQDQDKQENKLKSQKTRLTQKPHPLNIAKLDSQQKEQRNQSRINKNQSIQSSLDIFNPDSVLQTNEYMLDREEEKQQSGPNDAQLKNKLISHSKIKQLEGQLVRQSQQIQLSSNLMPPQFSQKAVLKSQDNLAFALKQRERAFQRQLAQEGTELEQQLQMQHQRVAEQERLQEQNKRKRLESLSQQVNANVNSNSRKSTPMYSFQNNLGQSLEVDRSKVRQSVANQVLANKVTSNQGQL